MRIILTGLVIALFVVWLLREGIPIEAAIALSILFAVISFQLSEGK